MSDTKLGKDVVKDLLASFNDMSGKDHNRAFECAMSYYGLGGKPSLTLEMIGSSMTPPLTRERIRQIIDAGVSAAKEREQVGKKGAKPFFTAKETFEKLLSSADGDFIEMEALLSHPYFKSFEGNPKGLSSFISDVGIRQVVYRGGQYLYKDGQERKEIIKQIQSVNKKARRSQTEMKADGMSKTVTYVPLSIKGILKSESKVRVTALNRLYEEILTTFSQKKPFKNPSDFEKTRSWKARKGMAEWVQIGIYIDKSVFQRAQKEADRIGVSLMSYICKSFCWFAENPKNV